MRGPTTCLPFGHEAHSRLWSVPKGDGKKTKWDEGPLGIYSGRRIGFAIYARRGVPKGERFASVPKGERFIVPRCLWAPPG